MKTIEGFKLRKLGNEYILVGERWRKASQLKYWELLHKADEQIVLSPDYRPDCFLRRDRYMVEHASRLIAYFNGIPKGGTFYTVNEAKRQGVMVENIY